MYMLYVYLFICGVYQVHNLDKTWLKYIEYAESEFSSFEFVICKFNIIYMNIK